MSNILHINHWYFEDYRQRMTTKEWKTVLLEGSDRPVIKGEFRQLKAKKLGYGVVEVYKESLED